MTLLKLLNRLFHGPAWLTFLFMGIVAGGFALCSFNLLYLFQANFTLIATYGAMAAFDGGVLQLIELTAWGDLPQRTRRSMKTGIAQEGSPNSQ